MTFGSRLVSLVAAALLLGFAAPAWSQDVFHGNDNNDDDPRQQSGLPGPGDDNGLFLRRPRGLHYCPRDHGYYRDSRTCGRLEGQDLQPPPAMADDAALVSTCGTILQQNGNFRNSISCKSGRVTGFCEQYGASDPECPAIMAQLRREVPNLGGLTYDGSRSISSCQHNPRSAGCKSVTRQPDPDLTENGQSTGPASRVPNPPAGAILATLESCLSRKLTYYRPPDNRQSDGVIVPVLYGGALYYSPRIMANLPLAERAFRLEAAVARNVQEQHDRQFGVRDSSADPRFQIHQIVGYLYHCLMNAGLVPEPENNSPDDPRLLYKEYLGPGADSDARVDEFDVGFRGDPVVPESLKSGR